MRHQDVIFLLITDAYPVPDFNVPECGFVVVPDNNCGIAGNPKHVGLKGINPFEPCGMDREGNCEYQGCGCEEKLFAKD